MYNCTCISMYLLIKKLFMCVSEKNLYQAPILIADINSEQSLLAMCKQARVLLNCVGPVSNTSTVVILKI